MVAKSLSSGQSYNQTNTVYVFEQYYTCIDDFFEATQLSALGVSSKICWQPSAG